MEHLAMNFGESIPGVSPVQIANPKPQKQRKHNLHLTQREAAELRLARPDRFCGTCHNLRWRPSRGYLPIYIKALKKSNDEKWCYTCGLLLDWVERLMVAHREDGAMVTGKEPRGKVMAIDLIFRDTLELKFRLEEQVDCVRWRLHTLLGEWVLSSD